MILYIQSDSLYRIDKVELVDGCYPTITYNYSTIVKDDKRSLASTDQYSMSDLNIEPAIWGIILILDRVCVDVVRQRFSWSTKGLGDISDEPGDKDSSTMHYVNGQQYEYDDNIDELFSLAEYLITISHSRTNSIIENEEEQSSLVRMLYCCILPKIKIYPKDLNEIEDAIKNEIKSISTLEKKIEQHSLELDDTYKVLYKQHEDRLQEFQDIAWNKKCTRKFVSTLDGDLKKTQNELRQQIDVNQMYVQNIKGDIEKHGKTEDTNVKLINARKETARLVELLQRVLMVTVDVIGDCLQSESEFQHVDDVPLVLEYLRCKEMLEKQKLTARQHMEKKVRATSVLENLKRIKEEIRKNDYATNATMISSSGIRATDVINSDVPIPEYQTLSERVTCIVNNPEHPFGEEFMKFTKSVRQKCRDILNGTARRRNTGRDENSYLVIGNDSTLKEEYLIPLEELCNEMKDHFDHIALLLLNHFSSTYSDVLKRKLQLCYEENVYDVISKDIINVYEVAYKDHKEKMIQDLERLTTFPINCLDLAMKDEWWLQLFEKRRQMNVARQRSSRKSGVDTGTSFNQSCSPQENGSISGSSKDTLGREQQHSDKRTTTSLQRKFIQFVRRKSREVSEAEQNDNVESKNTCCYDNYDNYRTQVLDKNEIFTNDRNGIIEKDEKDINVNDTGLDNMGNGSPTILNYEKELSTFAKYFGPSLKCLKDIFEVSSVFGKLKCLTACLKKVTDAVYELRQQVLEKVDNEREYSLAITADDLLPLIVLIILQMETHDAATIVIHLKMMQDLSPKFLTLGCHGYALVEFEMASKVLQSLCLQFDWSTSFSSLPN